MFDGVFTHSGGPCVKQHRSLKRFSDTRYLQDANKTIAKQELDQQK